MTQRHNKLKELHKTIDAIVEAREIQKAKVDANLLTEELSQEELEKFHKPMVKLIQEKSGELANIARRTDIAIEGPPSGPLPIAGPQEQIEYPTTSDSKESFMTPKESSMTPEESSKESSKESSMTPKESSKRSSKRSSKKSPLNVFYPDKGINEHIVKNKYGFNMPSEIVEDPTLCKSNRVRVLTKLKSLGGQKNSINPKPKIDEEIKALSTYNERLKLIQKGLDQQSQSPSQTGKGITYKYYSSCDELIERLNLLCGSKDAGNNSSEVRNEIVSILDILLNHGLIKPQEHNSLYTKWCC